MQGLSPRVRTKEIAESNPRLVKWLIIASAFADASVFPFPIATLFIMTVLIYPEKSRSLILSGTLATLSGAIAGYIAGRYAWTGGHEGFSGLAQFVFNHVPGFSIQTYQRAGAFYERWGLLILFFGAFTPIPYSLFSVTSGVFSISPVVFAILTLVSHSVKYFVLSFLSVRLSDKVMKYFMISRRAGLAILLAIVVIAAITALIID